MILTGPPTRARTVLATVFALAAFAANSVLCRLALRPGAIDAASFSTIRLMSGAAMLLLLSRWAPAPTGPPAGSWMSAAVLALYAVPFSFAYIGLSTGTGALILFGSVQVTMMAGALRSGERPLASQWLGLGLALVGLVYLVLPGIAAPPPLSAGLMALAGLAWGIYSLRGRGAVNPLAQTTSAFVRSVPIALALSAIFFRQFHAGVGGIALAVASGTAASGMGYVAWYAALRGLTATRAAVVQLSVPIIAAVGGIVFLSEALSTRLVIASLLVLGGVAMSIAPILRWGRKTTV